ncbi:TIR domain-containing protein [Methylomonas sp. OY6]|uniref:TIR domain-containing protein n=1 Tax=Methylomonas defluvii TaxID=3045149 RepID=A0ABU4UN41_9GAMM|nr:TIR domain-containing protein [Methylomonas sp. OY6]MDX8130124.1 TIR domain-containing protein [Methylomonas sp. OY6]
MEKHNLFISYSWDSEEHKGWTKNIADRLEEFNEFHIAFDQYDLDSFEDKNLFMEQGVFQTDIVLVIVTTAYVEKANGRLGGVGIETKMSVSRHWEESSSLGKSKIIPLLREGEILPNYLKEKFFIDFRSDDNFEKSFHDLLKHIIDDAKERRPTKKHSIHQLPPIKNLTRIEDFLKINHKKRKLVFDKSETTDFSSKNRIKFELWETRSPSIDYYLFLFENITLSSTIKRFCELVKRDKIKIKTLTVLRENRSEKGYLRRMLLENGIDLELTELTYSEYIWDFCIDDDAKNNKGTYKNPFFIDQPLVDKNDEQELGPAFEYIIKQLNLPQQSAAKIIVAPGGTGKTTLCQHIAGHYQGSGNAVSVLMQSEELKSEGFGVLSENTKIESVYDLYETYARICERQGDGGFIFDKVTFEVALLTGKLVLIIDGIDEFISIFPEMFNLDLFLQSIDDLNNELASSKIIVTSRNDVFNEAITAKYENIDKYNLLGFDNKACDKYLKKRFGKYDNSEKMIRKVLSNIEPLIIKDKDERIMPFIVDLLSSIVEDASENDDIRLDLSFDGKDYKSNEDITDYLVYSILRRESVRQSIEIKISEVLDLFLEIAASYTEIFPRAVLEELVSAYYSENAENLTGKLLKNPLIELDKEYCRFKYDFISDYFRGLSIINSITKKRSDDDFVLLASKYAFGHGGAFKEVIKYFNSRSEEFIECAQKILKDIRRGISLEDVFSKRDIKFKAISFFVEVLSFINGVSTSKEEFSDVIKRLFSANGEIKHLAIYGNAKTIDFSGMRVVGSRFVGYNGFTSSKFEGARFVNCYFEGINGNSISESFKADMFESCRLGDLENIIDVVKQKLENNREVLEKELRKFFGSFFRRNKFTDQKKAFVKFSDRTGLNSAFFNELIKRGIIVIFNEKADETYYSISDHYKDSVYGFLVNNKIDKKTEEIIKIVEK